MLTESFSEDIFVEFRANFVGGSLKESSREMFQCILGARSHYLKTKGRHPPVTVSERGIFPDFKLHLWLRTHFL